MSERIFEETAVVIKMKNTIRFLEYKENGQEFTEINIYSREVTEQDDKISDYFLFGFTVKGRAEEERKKIEKMSEREFEEVIRHMKHFIEKKYNIVRHKIDKKLIEQKAEEATDADDSDVDITDVDNSSDTDNIDGIDDIPGIDNVDNNDNTDNF